MDKLENEEFNSYEKDEIIATKLSYSDPPSSDVHADQSKIVDQFSCDICGYDTDVKVLLFYHINSRHKKTDKQTKNKFNCPIFGCNKTFKSHQSLIKHQSGVHKFDSQEEKSTCNQCGKVCKNKRYLQSHQRTHLKFVKCKICFKSFTHRVPLIDHMSTYHTNNSKFDCTECPKSFKSQHKLNLHQRRTHSEKKFKCDQCDAAFRAPSVLRDHVKYKHEGKSDYYRSSSYLGCSEK